MQNKVEIMAPVGSFESLIAAIKAGADSVYFGIEKLNMRARSANNFRLKDLNKIVSICKENKVRCYLTLNIIMYDKDLKLIKKICNHAKKENVDAVIASDLSVISYANSIGLKIHCSTQLNISNIEAVRFYSKYAEAMVLARELTIKQIKAICEKIKEENIRGPNKELVRIEIFAHGALCVAIAGKCYMSLATYNSSANRGACFQNCRRSYKVIDEETGYELNLDNKYIMSPKDLCTISFMDTIIKSGISILKIEGRGRGPEYVFTTTKVYKEATESIYQGKYTKENIEKWTKELESVFNRGFWHGGYYLGNKLGEWSNSKGNKATKEKSFIGIVKNYFLNKNITEVIIQAGSLKVNDEILINGPTTGVVKAKVENIRINAADVSSAKKGDLITMPIKERVRKNDKLFVLKTRQSQ